MRSKLNLLYLLIIFVFILLASKVVIVSASGSWTVNAESDDNACSDSVDNDSDSYIDWSDLSCRSLVQGYVKDEFGNPVFNTSVYVIGSDNEMDLTDSLGYYELYAIPHTNPLGSGSYNYFFAINSTHKSNIIDERDIKSEGITYLENHSVNFTMFQNNNICESDCTYTTDTLCHVECLGLNGCSNSIEFDTLGFCGSTQNPYEVGTILTINTTHKVVCCNQDPYRYVPEDVDNTKITEINPNLNNVRTIERNVFLNGQTYKIHVVVFNKE